MIIGHYQCGCAQGDFQRNLATVLRGLREADRTGVDILSFPECILTGYFRQQAEAERNSFAVESPQMREVLEQTSGFRSVFMVGFNERRGDDLFNTVMIIERGRIVGSYSKAFPCFGYFTPGRDFPVFDKDGLRFGVIICADGGYMEPARILALRGARLIFAPHFNHVADPVEHYQMVRNDHVARAVENGVYFLRGNNVVPRSNPGPAGEPVRFGYGDSYLLDPHGQVVAGAGLYQECLMIYHLDPDRVYRVQHHDRNRASAAALGDRVRELAAMDPKCLREDGDSPERAERGAGCILAG